jgi:hypothetical protein
LGVGRPLPGSVSTATSASMAGVGSELDLRSFTP